MQKRIIILSIAIIVIGFIVSGYISKEPTIVNKKIALSTTEIVDTNIIPKTETILKEEDLFYSVGGRFKHFITHEKLKNAKLLRDIVPNYPINWIAKYDAVEILVITNGAETKTISKNEVLTAEQRRVFKTIKASDAIYFNVKYKTKNAVSDELDSREMNVSIGVVPNTPAEYIGGYKQMIDYIKKGSVDKIVGKTMEKMKFTRLNFIVNKRGNIEQVKVKDSSGDSEVDEVLFKLISEMPKWNPAKNADGKLVNQRLEFILTYGDNC